VRAYQQVSLVADRAAPTGWLIQRRNSSLTVPGLDERQRVLRREPATGPPSTLDEHDAAIGLEQLDPAVESKPGVTAGQRPSRLADAGASSSGIGSASASSHARPTMTLPTPRGPSGLRLVGRSFAVPHREPDITPSHSRSNTAYSAHPVVASDVAPRASRPPTLCEQAVDRREAVARARRSCGRDWRDLRFDRHECLIIEHGTNSAQAPIGGGVRPVVEMPQQGQLFQTHKQLA
jgi:hypothetical protein